ncbi:hypothetical protein GOC77_14015 [Haloarcula argentinensis]|uniref:Uncharacterized protein n=2 Tax=Haloarcula argentinensis TaxID=43776 RepID=A0A847UL43_HALAR|nr:hypothetical protein [Haloarcula argentinensis]
MKDADKPMLRVLRRAEFPKRSSTILWVMNREYDIDVAESTFYRRLKYLVHAELVEKIDESYYEITDLGERLLDEDLSDSEAAELSQRLQEGPPDDS